MALPEDIVLFSTADWDHPIWTNKQHVACQLADRGFRVLYVDSLGLRKPTVHSADLSRIGRRLRKSLSPLRQVRENLHVLSPLVAPFHRYQSIRQLNDYALRLQLSRAQRTLGFKRPAIWTYNPLVAELIASMPAGLRIYHAVDDLAAAPLMPSAAIRSAEARLAVMADHIFVTSRALEARFASVRPEATHYAPNVVDFDHFATPGREPPQLADIPHPRIGFVGAVNEYKIDLALLADAAKARPELQWVLVGPHGEGQPNSNLSLLDLPNIHLLGAKPYSEIPSYLHAFDLAIIPAIQNGYTDAMFPMKFFEYLAAGLPIVATDVPAIREYQSYFHLARTAQEFLYQIDLVLSGNGKSVERGEELAARHTWKWRMDEMLSVFSGEDIRRLDTPQPIPTKVPAQRGVASDNYTT